MEDQPASILLTEYKKWSELNDSKFMLQKAGDSHAQGSFFINLSIDEKKHFTLYCPLDYPHTSEGRFFVESVPSLRYWCNAMNEYILESSKDVSLEDILNKAAVLYDTQGHANEGSSSLVETVSGEDACKVETRKWDEIQTSNNDDIANPNPTSSGRPKLPQPYEILMKEMLAITEANIPGIHVARIDGEMNKWAVFLSCFFDRADLNSDLKWLDATYGYEFIELQLVFALDAYPFHPPTIRIIRPRLQGISITKISSLITCSTWVATCDLVAMLQSVKTSIGEKGRVDKKSETNNPRLYPQGVCTSIEHDLIALAWLMDFPFGVYKVLTEQTTARATMPAPRRPASRGWYASFKKKLANVSGWVCRMMTDKTVASTGPDLELTPQLSSELDGEIERLIRNINQEVARYENRLSIDSDIESSSCSRLTSCSPTFSSCGDTYSKTLFAKENIFRIIEDSQFMDLIVKKLEDESLFDMCRHKRVYQAIIEILIDFKSYRKLSAVFTNLSDNDKVLTASFKRLETESGKILSLFDWTPHDEGKMVMYPIQKRQMHRHIAVDDVEWCYNFNMLCKLYLQNTCEADLVEPPCQTIPQKLEPSLEDKYKCALKGLRVITCDLQAYCARSQFFGRLRASQKTLRPICVMRVLKEISAMATSLPLELGSSIFVCSGESNCMFMRALIVGPEDTPYSNGCFMFDVFFPDRYPNVPPKVHFCTTGHGTVDFSPNLYSNGDICLSLLGTWPGTGGELWYKTSTLLQVLVSIQGLVLVANPYFNEPLNAPLQNTELGERNSRDYNKEIYANTITHAMLPHLQRPDPCFKRILQAHFTIKKEKILQEVEAKLAQNPTRDLRKAARKLKAYLSIPEEVAASAA